MIVVDSFALLSSLWMYFMRSSLMLIVYGLFFYVRAFDLNSKEIVRGIGEGISKILPFVLSRTLFRFGLNIFHVDYCFIYPF